MKLYIKLFLLATIAIAIYLIFPRYCDKLIYIPSSNDYYSEDAIKLQNIPLNSVDLVLLSFLDTKEAWIRLESNTINKWQLYNKIAQAKKAKSRKMVMYGGETIDNFLKKIAKQANLNINTLKKIYKKYAYYKEGDIVAKKYNIPFKVTEQSTLAFMLYNSHKIYNKISKENKIVFPSKEFKKYLIIASIIEKETQNYKEMPLISAVIHNRLKKNMRLQLDATLNYGKRAHTIITPQIIKSDKSKYNTYKYKGLPPEPICSPSVKALKSALNPANEEYIYFVKNGDSHTFSSIYKEHINNVANYKKALAKKLAFKRKINNLINKPIKLKFPILIEKFNILIKP